MTGLDEQRSLVRLGALTGLDRTLVDLGVDPEPVLAEFGLPADALIEGDRLIPLEQAAALLERAAAVSGREHFPLELAARQDENLLGAVGLLVQTAETVRQAMQESIQYMRQTHVSHIHWNLLRRGEFEAFEVSAELPTLSSQQLRMVFELAVAQCYRIYKSVTAGRLEMASICFRQGDRSSLPRLGRFFHAPVQVNAEFDGILFRQGALDLKIPKADVQAHETLRRLIQHQQAPLAVDSLAEQVKVLIRPLLPTGQCNIERIARFFACDKRTLQRHLREESDTSFQRLLDEVRFDAACFYLSEASLPITQLAQLAGFSEATNFSRAFRQRFGVTPRQWRKENREPVVN